ncbi:MAG: phenylalanine--tRNA ligase subunit beta, partial [Gemmatimonadetes bacterium]
MNVSYRWLRAIAPAIEDAPETLAERLASRGAPVESLEPVGEGLEGVIVGRVVSVRRHPNADRLSLCEVDDGENVVQVVCGAPVIHEGACYPFARPGVTLPGGIKLKKAKIRGEVSNGMLCSERELGLGRDASGILRLPGDFTPGQSLIEALGLDDVRLDVEVTANRGDLLSHVGVAREAAPGGVADLELPELPGAPCVELDYARDEACARAGDVEVRIDAPELCPRYLGAVVRGVEVGPSPAWLQARLRAAGAQPINNVVDATNYVLLELGQPMHAFDLDRLAGGRIVVRRAAEGEPITTLDDEERTLTSSMLAICDGERPVAVAGVMGGADSEVRAETTDVLLECALFEPKSVRATRRALGLSTDASYRFERGVDPEGLERALERCVALVLAVAGGRVDGPVLDVNTRPFEPFSVRVRPSRVHAVLGIPFEPARIGELLEPLGFGVERAGDDALDVRVPGFRSYDVTREIDVIEEVARVHGYDGFPETLGPSRPSSVPDHALFALEADLRALLVARGLLEAQNPPFVGDADGDVRVLNPVSAVEGHLRRAVLP